MQPGGGVEPGREEPPCGRPTEDAAKALAAQRADAIAQAIVRYAHTGGAAQVVAADPKAVPPKGTNVIVTVLSEPAPKEGTPEKPSENPPEKKP